MAKLYLKKEAAHTVSGLRRLRFGGKKI